MEQQTATRIFVRDALDALAGERAEDGLRALAALREDLDRIEAEHVATLRANGESWSAIGAALGVSASAAWQRFARR